MKVSLIHNGCLLLLKEDFKMKLALLGISIILLGIPWILSSSGSSAAFGLVLTFIGLALSFIGTIKCVSKEYML